MNRNSTLPTGTAAAPRPSLTKGIWVLLLALLFQACTKNTTDDPVAPQPQSKMADAFSADVALQWSEMHLKLIRSSAGFTPPVASRSFGYAGLAMYEALVPGLPNHQSMAGQLQGLATLPKPSANQAYNWALSVNAAQAYILKNLFANTSDVYKSKIDSLESVLTQRINEADAETAKRSGSFGRSVAQAIFEWSKTDGGHEGYGRNFPAGYVVPVGPGLWQPTENGRKIPMQPYWGKNRLFVSSNATLPMPTPIPVSTDVKSPYFAQYLDVYTKNKTLTQAEKEISVWWADDPSETFTPPGHSYNLARIAIMTAKSPLGKAAEAFARVGVAVSDAFTLCWKCKYTYNNERPYTYVRRAIDPNWVPFWPAPPFPGFTSGHATQSAATAVVLGALYGDSFAFTDDSHVGRVRDVGRKVDFKARSYNSFMEAAQESALSRFLGGIHTRQDNDTGLAEGKLLGRNVNRLNWTK
ncbi:MAG: vanadium-dependent haloperoxidase [Bacteroidetes bacterium]|nr:vanadium-dependent haloperoxidase [Fibrella sp.]